jgi:hypothetical protein
MPSRIIPLEDLRQRSVMFWLPPGGRDNGVWADTWVIIAEVEPADAAPILDSLRDADIGGYIASPTGLHTAGDPIKRLYVDREQHGRAADVLMLFLRSRNQSTPREAVNRARIRPTAQPKARPFALRALLMVLQIAFLGAFFALMLTLAYYKGAEYFPGVHPTHHPAPDTNLPGMKPVSP